MSKPITNTPIEEDEISLKDFILKIREYVREVFRNWILLFLIPLPFIVYFLYQAFTTPLIYNAELTFMLNDDEGGSAGGAMAILSQFGFAGGSGGGKYNMEKIMELSKTRKLIQLSVFEKSTINEKNDFLANHLIDIYDLHEAWKESDLLRDFKFQHDSIPAFELKENSALKRIQSLLLGNKKRAPIYFTNIDEETGIMTLSASTLSEGLSIDLLNFTFENLGRYYTDKSIEKQQYTYNIVKQKVDSLKASIDATQYQLAKFQDSNRGMWTKISNLEVDRLNRNLQLLSIMYGEAIKNQEIADFSLKSKTPVIQLIDPPIAPIFGVGQSKIMAIILGALLGGFLAVGFIIIRKILRDALKD